MLNVSFLASTKTELWDLTICIVVNGGSLKAYSDLDLDPIMPNIELVQAFFIYYKVFKFCVPRSITF